MAEKMGGKNEKKMGKNLISDRFGPFCPSLDPIVHFSTLRASEEPKAKTNQIKESLSTHYSVFSTECSQMFQDKGVGVSPSILVNDEHGSERWSLTAGGADAHSKIDVRCSDRLLQHEMAY